MAVAERAPAIVQLPSFNNEALFIVCVKFKRSAVAFD